MKVCIFDIKRFAVHDGPGIRTTVFFKGCPLKCWWCHNPEGILGDIEVFKEEISFDGANLQKEISVGRWIEVDDLMFELEKDRIFMDESGGGISFSGGEPLNQSEALFQLIEISRERKIHTTVDTSGYTSPENISKASELADLLLFDLKTMDDEKHKRYIGVSNQNILLNLEKALDGSADIVVRIPLISGFNDTIDDIKPMIDFLVGLKKINAVDILPYHPFGTNKYRRFKRENKQNGFATPSKKVIEEIRKTFTEAGFRTVVER